MEGIIFDIKHYAIHDGPGIRTTVFFKGCPLGCWWCHNPESRSKEICQVNRLEKLNGKELVQSETIGKHYEAREVINEVLKDTVLYEESQGGVTLSGGEPFYQFDFLIGLLKMLKKHDIHACIDTTGQVQKEKLIESAKYTDLFLYDLKHIDDDKHQKYTGVSNKTILNNLIMLDSLSQPVEIRYPLIPGINDDEADLLRLLSFLKDLKGNYPLTILPYHKIGSQKYGRFGIEYKMENISEPSSKQVNRMKEIFETAGIETKIGG